MNRIPKQFRAIGKAGFLLLQLLLFFALPVQAASVLDGFAPNIDNTVYTTAVQADGKLLVGGAFTTIGGNAKNHLARLNTDGTVDTTFSADTNGDIYSIIVQPDGQILVGGDFTTIGGQTRDRIARLNPDGSPEVNFAPVVNQAVRAIALQLDGDIVIGGDFTTINSETRSYIARLSAGNGSLDPDYNPNANAVVYSLATQRNGKVVAGGNFTNIGGRDRGYIARLNEIDGSVETIGDPPAIAFDISANGAVRTIVIQTDGKVLIGGDFTSLVDKNGTHTRNRIALLDADGDTDFNFDPNANDIVRSIILQPDGEVLVGGEFTAIGGQTRNHIARLGIEFGYADDSFAPSVDNTVYAISVQPDEKIVLGGTFTSLTDGSTHTRNRLARLHFDGSVEADFIPNIQATNTNDYATISSVAVQADGKILVGGTFNEIGGETRNNLARLNLDGTIDPTFVADTNGAVSAIVVQANGKILVAGNFTTIGGEAIPYLARLNTDGSVDSSFTPYPNSRVHAIAVQIDGNIIVGGQFTTIGGMARKNLARVYGATGAGDTTYETTTDGPVYALVVQGDGKLVVGGDFTSIGGQGRTYIARVAANGGVDSTTVFKNTGANKAVRTLALQADGTILVGGDFTTIDGATARNYIARLKADGDIDPTFNPNASGPAGSIVSVRSVAVHGNNILVGGNFTAIGGITRQNLAKISSAGVVDTEFTANADTTVHSIAIHPDGYIFAGGAFTTITDHTSTSFPRKHLVKINSTDVVDSTFDPGASSTFQGPISAIKVQSDGKILVGGLFTQIGGATRNNLVRLNSTGSPDTSFTTDTNGAVSSIVMQADGKILVGGSFTTIGGYATPYLARLNSDGTVDTSFTPNPDNIVHTIAVQSDGKIIVGGQFATIGGMVRANIARLLSTGTGDSTYTTIANGPVYALVVQSDGKLVVGGDFTTIGGQSRTCLARLATNGTVDTTALFKNTGTDATVRTLALQADGAILVGGDFTTIDAVARNYVARLKADGDLDTSFNADANGIVRSIVAQADTNILVGGDFTTLGGVPRTNFAQISSVGIVDTAFTANANDAVHSIAVQADGQILVAGAFTTIGGAARNHIARIATTDTVDATFAPNATAISRVLISAIAAQGDGKLLIGGLFSHIDGTPSNHIARLHPNGSLDTTWHTHANGEITSIVFLSNDKILISGNFTSITDANGSFARNSLARLNANGTVDGSFNPLIHGQVYAMAEETALTTKINGNILIAGDFTSITMTNPSTGAITKFDRPFIARFTNIDEPEVPALSVDTFNSTATNNPNAIVRTIATQTDGKILVGGDFSWIGNLAREKIARLIKASGASDTTFDPNSNGTVRSIVVQPNGDILVGGDFSYIGNQTRNGIARLYKDSAKADGFNPNANDSVHAIAMQTDGNILAIGKFTRIGDTGGVDRNHIARLTPLLGVADSFNPAIDLASTVAAIAVQADGKIVVGGDFTTVDLQARNRMARFSADSAALQDLRLSVDGQTITWNRSQSSPELHDVVFYESANNTVWTKIPAATTRTTEGWQLTVPAGALFQRQNRYIAASAKTSGGFYNGSTSSIQTVNQYFLDYYTLTVSPDPTTGWVESNLVGIECGSVDNDCSETYQADTALKLTATPVEGGYVYNDGFTDYIFTHWGGTGNDCGTGTTNPAPVLMNTNKTCTANFAKAYTSLLLKTGAGSGTVDWGPDEHIDGLAPEGKVYESGKTAKVTAVADAGSIFTGWTGNCSGTTSPFDLVMNGDKSCTATFKIARTLTITTSGGGSGTVGGAGIYADGTNASASATANPGSKFTGWSGDCSGTNNPLTVLMDRDKSCTANFEPAWTMTVNKSGTGDGTVGGAGVYVNGTTATVSATANSTSLFTGWSGDCSGTTSPVTVLMDRDKSCTANFELKRTLTITKTGTGTVTGAGTYANGTTAQATAVAGAGFVFSGWSGDCSGTTSPLSVLMDRNKSCAATFVQGYTLAVSLTGNGTGVVTSDDTKINCPAGVCSQVYISGSTVTLTATPDGEFLFKGWQGTGFTCPGTDPCTITMNANVNISARFQKKFSWLPFFPAIIKPQP